MKRITVLGFLTTQNMESKEAGKKLFEIIYKKASSFMPQKYDNGEPIERRFNYSQLDEVLSIWENGFLWKRSSPMASGSFWLGSTHGLHNAVYLSIEGLKFNTKELMLLLTEGSKLFNSTIGYIHRIYEEELLDLEFYKNQVMPFSQGVTTHDLKKGLPGICWMMYFGEPYITLIGREKLLSSPVYRSEDLKPGIVLQLTESINTPEEDYEAFKSIREKVILHLGYELFSFSDKKEKQIPDFSLSK